MMFGLQSSNLGGVVTVLLALGVAIMSWGAQSARRPNTNPW
ncbi:hypothetical protein V1289_001662 [Bradyrhizobium sp. AZCC 2289]